MQKVTVQSFPKPANTSPAGGSVVEYARIVAANKKKSMKVLRNAKVVTASGKLAAAYR